MDNHILEHAGSGVFDILCEDPTDVFDDWYIMEFAFNARLDPEKTVRKVRARRALLYPSQGVATGAPAISAPAARTRPTAASINWPPGYAGELAKLIYNRSIRPVKEVAIATAFGVLAGICGRNWNTPTDSGLNLYIAFIGRSAIGKEAISEGVNMVKNIALTNGSTCAADFFSFDDVASGPALIKCLADKTSFLHVSGEFGRTVKGMATDQQGPLSTLRTQMTKFYQKSGVHSASGGITYSNKDNSRKIDGSVAYSVIGDSTPGTFFEALSSSMMEDGFLSRFVIIDYDGDRPPENANRTFPDNSFATWIAGLIFSAAQARAPIKVEWTDASLKMRIEFNAECDAEINNTNDESIRQMWNRAELNVQKIACLMAVADNHSFPKVTREHYKWALALIRRNIVIMCRRLDTGDVGSDDSARERKLVSILRDYLTAKLPPSYKVPEEMRANSIVPRSYLQIRIGTSCPAFANYLGRNGDGNVLAISHTIQSCIDQGYLMEVDKAKVVEAYNYHGKSYRILKLPDYAAIAKDR